MGSRLLRGAGGGRHARNGAGSGRHAVLAEPLDPFVRRGYGDPRGPCRTHRCAAKSFKALATHLIVGTAQFRASIASYRLALSPVHALPTA